MSPVPISGVPQLPVNPAAGDPTLFSGIKSFEGFYTYMYETPTQTQMCIYLIKNKDMSLFWFKLMTCLSQSKI